MLRPISRKIKTRGKTSTEKKKSTVAPVNREMKKAGKQYGFEAKGGRDEGYGYMPSTSTTRNHYSLAISNWIDSNKKDPMIKKHFPNHDGNGGNVMMYGASKGRMHPLTKHPDFPSDAKGFLKYTQDKESNKLQEESKLISAIIEKNYDAAKQSLEEELSNIVERKIGEKKKMVAAGLPWEPSITPTPKRIKGVRPARKKDRPELKPMTKVAEESEIEEGIIKDKINKMIADRWHAKSDKKDKEIIDQIDKDRKKSKVKTKFPVSKKPRMDLRQTKYPIRAGRSVPVVKEATVNDKGLVELSTGEQVLASVYRQRRWLAEENLEADNAKIEAALAKAKLLLHPELDTEAPDIDRKKVVRPKGGHAHVDHPPAVDEGPREDEWESGKIHKGK